MLNRPVHSTSALIYREVSQIICLALAATSQNIHDSIATGCYTLVNTLEALFFL